MWYRQAEILVVSTGRNPIVLLQTKCQNLNSCERKIEIHVSSQPGQVSFRPGIGPCLWGSETAAKPPASDELDHQ